MYQHPLREIALEFLALPKRLRGYGFSYAVNDKLEDFKRLTEDDVDPWIGASTMIHAYEAQTAITVFVICGAGADEKRHAIGETTSKGCGDRREVADAVDAIIAEFTDCLGFVEEEQGAA